METVLEYRPITNSEKFGAETLFHKEFITLQDCIDYAFHYYVQPARSDGSTVICEQGNGSFWGWIIESKDGSLLYELEIMSFSEYAGKEGLDNQAIRDAILKLHSQYTMKKQSEKIIGE